MRLCNSDVYGAMQIFMIAVADCPDLSAWRYIELNQIISL